MLDNYRQGHFTLRSAPGTPLIFVAGGTGFAPIKAMIEQQLAIGPSADIRLFWGAAVREELYELDILSGWTQPRGRVNCMLAVDHGPLPEALPAGVSAVSGNVAQAIAASAVNLASYDGYVAGPLAMISSVVDALAAADIERDRIRIDSFGL